MISVSGCVTVKQVVILSLEITTVLSLDLCLMNIGSVYYQVLVGMVNIELNAVTVLYQIS